MAKDPLGAQEPAPSLDQQLGALVDAISQGIVKASKDNATGPIKQINITQYRTKTPLNPEGRHDHERPQMTRVYFQNGTRVEMWHVSDKQIALLNRLKAGRYLGRKLEVVERLSESGEPNAVEIRYSNATFDQRLDLKNHGRDFGELLSAIIAEQDGALVGA